ncbi:hypothetical protein [Maricaulis salignorans]|uniref:Uncharacterized protein n=1 Tax=Maricaulis salignorans TaxID=144026 RepID=A0A1G9PW74_9PROT|nr:hypothetical protein [Maricaulis salignorans]SDM02731.1 hypothetical protein SAMN04488568_10448 [Maricaulis salignorans]
MLPAASLFGARFSPDDLAAIRERAGTEGRSIADVFSEAVEDQVRRRQQAGVRPEVRALMEDIHRKYASVFEALARM